MGLMTSGGWRSSVADELAAEWQVNASEVRRAAAEASRHIRISVGESRDEIVGVMVGMLEEAAGYAREAVADSPIEAGKLLVAIVKQHAVLAGVNAPTKIALTDSKGVDVLPASIMAVLEDPVGAELYLRTGGTRIPSQAEVDAEKTRLLAAAVDAPKEEELWLAWLVRSSPMRRGTRSRLSASE